MSAPVVADLAWYEMLLRVGVAALLGGLLGAEREADGHEAGLRTHLLLALGAALFGLISVGAFDDFAGRRGDTNFQVDVTRVASYVAAGVGFLGAGAILKHGLGIKGLTTAASLWATAAVGLAAGLGFWLPAVATTAIGLLSLTALRPVRSGLKRIRRAPGGRLVVNLRPGADPQAFLSGLGELDRLARRLDVEPGSEERGPRITVDVPRGAEAGLTALAGRLAGMEGVTAVSLERPE